MALFGISDNVWLDKNTVNVVTGIAGASKTGDVVEFYGSRGCSILYLPITHQLRNDENTGKQGGKTNEEIKWSNL